MREQFIALEHTAVSPKNFRFGSLVFCAGFLHNQISFITDKIDSFFLYIHNENIFEVHFISEMRKIVYPKTFVVNRHIEQWWRDSEQVDIEMSTQNCQVMLRIQLQVRNIQQCVYETGQLSTRIRCDTFAFGITFFYT